MIVKINSENIKKLNKKIKRTKVTSLLLSGVLATSLLTGCNKTMVDTKYGFDKALILGDDTSIILDVANWLDYEGEQLQIITEDNMAILTSAFDTNAFYGQSENYGIKEVATSSISEDGEVYDYSSDKSTSLYNKSFFDGTWAFNKAVVFNGNNALVLPIEKWKDYEGEQLQIVTSNGLVLNLCSYNTKLINDQKSTMQASDFAQSYVGTDGIVTDISGENYKIFNYDLADFNFGFNKALILKDDSVIILPVDKWCDYEGEQIQINVTNGPTLLSAAYNTILINDIKSEIKANQVAECLCNKGKIYDLTEGYDYSKPIYFNGTIIDFNYGYTNGIVSNNNSATSFKVDKWNDYEGEQLQVKLETGDIFLTSSMFLNLVNGGNEQINASTLSSMFGIKTIDNSKGNTDSTFHNQYIIDTELKFNYALKVIDGNVTIIPLKSWQDFYNTDGKKGYNEKKYPFSKNYKNDLSRTLDFLLEEDEDEEKTAPNCEQIQLVLPDGSVIVTTSYDTILVKNVTDIKDLAEYFRGENGIITDLTPYVGEPDLSFWNQSLFDTKYNFPYAILSNGKTSQVFKVKNWLDFQEGEQLQLNLSDNTGFLTSFVNTTLVSPKTEGLEEILVASFNGTLDNGQKLIKTYE